MTARKAFSFSYKGEMYEAAGQGASVEMPEDLATRIRAAGLVDLPRAGVPAPAAAGDIERSSGGEAVPVAPAAAEPPAAEARPRRARKG